MVALLGFAGFLARRSFLTMLVLAIGASMIKCAAGPRIWNVDWPTALFIFFDQSEQGIEPTPRFGSDSSASKAINLFECSAVVFISADWSDVHLSQSLPNQFTRTPRDLDTLRRWQLIEDLVESFHVLKAGLTTAASATSAGGDSGLAL
jgi:hypothetical protein